MLTRFAHQKTCVFIQSDSKTKKNTNAHELFIHIENNEWKCISTFFIKIKYPTSNQCQKLEKTSMLMDIYMHSYTKPNHLYDYTLCKREIFENVLLPHQLLTVIIQCTVYARVGARPSRKWQDHQQFLSINIINYIIFLSTLPTTKFQLYFLCTLHAHEKRALLTKPNKDDDNNDDHEDNMMVMTSPRFHLGLILPENKVDVLSTKLWVY